MIDKLIPKALPSDRGGRSERLDGAVEIGG